MIAVPEVHLNMGYMYLYTLFCSNDICSLHEYRFELIHLYDTTKYF